MEWTHDTWTGTLGLNVLFHDPASHVPACRAAMTRDRETYRPGSGTHDLYGRLIDALGAYDQDEELPFASWEKLDWITILHLRLSFHEPQYIVWRCRQSLVRDREKYRPGSGTYDVYSALIQALGSYEQPE